MIEKRSACLIVGIAGGSASGKTTFTSVLSRELEKYSHEFAVEAIGMDKYFFRGASGGPRFLSPSSGEELPDNNHPDSADNNRLAADLDKFRNECRTSRVILLEGLMTLHVEEIRKRLDLKIFIELESDIRALRRLIRDMGGGRGNQDPRWISNYYIECARTGHNAYVEPSKVYSDFIVRGDADFERTARMISAAIRNEIHNK